MEVETKTIPNDPELQDVEFLVGPDKTSIRAYKLILALASPVFKAMLFGNWAETTETNHPIKLEDVSVEAFRLIIDYVYNGVVTLTSCNEAIDVYMAANKYMIMSLTKKCEDYMIEHFEPKFALQIYEVFNLHGKNEAMEVILEKCKANASFIFEADTFCKASIDSLIKIFEQDNLNIESELELIEALSRYIEENEEYVKDKESDMHPKVRVALNNIRFLTLTPKEFVECAAMENLLTPLEMYGILTNIISENSRVMMDKKFSSSNVKRCSMNVLHVKRTVCDIDCEKVIREHSASTIKVTISQTVTIEGVILATVFDFNNQIDPNFAINLAVFDKYGKEKLFKTIENIDFVRKEKIVYFPEKILIQRKNYEPNTLTLRMTFLKSAKLFGKYSEGSKSCGGADFNFNTEQDNSAQYFLKGLVITKF